MNSPVATPEDHIIHASHLVRRADKEWIAAKNNAHLANAEVERTHVAYRDALRKLSEAVYLATRKAGQA